MLLIFTCREIKCPPLGPKTHSRSQKWDFSETLVPAPCPVLEEETYRFLPSMYVNITTVTVKLSLYVDPGEAVSTEW